MFSIKTFKQSIGWIMAVAGGVCYIVGYTLKYHNTYLFFSDVLIKCADVLIIGVVVGYLTSVVQWMGIFKQEIQDVVFGKEFLNKRNDIEDIWNSVTKQMFKCKFADIHRDLLKALYLTLPSEDQISYYEDFDAETKVEWIDKEQGKIKSVDTMSMYIVAESDKEFSYPIKSWTIAENSETIQHNIQVSVDGQTLNDLRTTRKPQGNEICIETTITLKGKKRYYIQYTREKIYNINEDFYIAFKAKYLTNNLKVSLELPQDIEALFIERGTTNDFINVKNTKHHIKKSYKGVIFPKQGYIFALRTTNSN